MKTITFFLGLLITFGAMAQETDTITIVTSSTDKDTVRIKLGRKHILIIDDEIVTDDSLSYTFSFFDDQDTVDEDPSFDGHWAGIDLGLNGYSTTSQSITFPSESSFMSLDASKSWGVSLNPIEKNFNLYKERIGLVTGVGFDFNNYRFNHNISLIPNGDSLSFYADTVRQFDKTKLVTTYLTVPLILEAQIPVRRAKHSDKNIHIGAGVIGGVKIGSHTKVAWSENGIYNKDKVQDDFHLSTFRYGLTARIGYGGLNLFANYSLSSLFNENQGPELYPFTVGLSIIGF